MPAGSPVLDPTFLDQKSLRFLQRCPKYFNQVLIDATALGRSFPHRLPSPESMSKSAEIDAGTLRKLPPETIMMILQVTPLSGLFALRNTNSYLRRLIEEW